MDEIYDVCVHVLWDTIGPGRRVCNQHAVILTNACISYACLILLCPFCPYLAMPSLWSEIVGARLSIYSPL